MDPHHKYHYLHFISMLVLIDLAFERFMDYLFFGFGIPIHRGVLSMYSRYTSPYFLRQKRSSETTQTFAADMNTIGTSRKIHEAQDMFTPTKIKKPLKYMGCLETL